MDFEATLDYSGHSNQSDDAKSTVSSLSAVSVYGEEFAELRHLVDPEKYPSPTRNCSTPVYNDSGCDVRYEDRLADLSFQLQSTLNLNEKYKNDMFNLEKDIELRYHDRIETLLKNNKQLKVELTTANEKIDSLFKKFTSIPSSTVDKSFIQLEQKCHELSLSNSNLQERLIEVLKDKNEVEIFNKRLKIELEDCKIDKETKNVCIKELKEKISQQFMEIQAMIRSRNMNVQSLKESKFEVEHLKNFQEWNKEQLNAAQSDKKILIENLTMCKTELLNYKEKVDKANLDTKTWKNKFECLQLECLKTKEKLYKEIKSYSLENQKLPVENNCACIEYTNQALQNYYESNISDLQKEISSIKELIVENDNTIKKLTKENSDLTSRYLILQKTTQQKDLAIEEFNYAKNQLNMELNLMKQTDSEKSQEILELKNEINKLEAEVLMKREENQSIENNIKIVREQFYVFIKQYEKLKVDLLEKNKQILSLQNEKQELFMNNNWKVCELEKAKEKDTYIEKLKKQIGDGNQEIIRYVNKLTELQVNYEETCHSNSRLLEEKNNNFKNHNEEIERYENVLVQYRQTVQNLENQIKNLEQADHENTTTISDKEENIKILLNEINKRDSELAQLQNNLKLLNTRIVPKQQKTGSKNGVVLEQFQENLRKLEERLGNLNDKVETCSSALNGLHSAELQNNEKSVIRELKVLIQVKNLELKEKQKKYERNYHTLLRKVKEHMKGRKLAEKQNNYLQDLHESICNENNSLKLSLSLKESENANDKKSLGRYMNLNDNLKEKLLQLECEYKKRETCTRCFEYNVVNERLQNLEKFVKNLEKEKMQLQELILEKENLNMTLQNKIREMKVQLSNIHSDKNNFTQEIEIITNQKDKLLEEKYILEEKLRELQISVDDLNILLKKESQLVFQRNDCILILEQQMKDASYQIQCMKNDFDDLNTTLRAKTEELMYLEKDCSNKIIEWRKKYEDSENVIDNLKEHLNELQSEISSVTSEKHFLQRLCNDLKLALKSHVNYNKVLKDQVQQYPNEKSNFNSLPNNVLPTIVISNQYNEDYINELLNGHKGHIEKKSCIDLQHSLDNLRKEITDLQEQISKKNHTSE